jgi:hypothetical protein
VTVVTTAAAAARGALLVRQAFAYGLAVVADAAGGCTAVVLGGQGRSRGT